MSRQMRRWEEYESKLGRASSEEHIVEDYVVTGPGESALIKRVIDRHQSFVGLSRRSTREDSMTDDGESSALAPMPAFTADAPVEYLSGGKPKQIADKSFGGKLATGAFKLAKRGFNEVMWGHE